VTELTSHAKRAGEIAHRPDYLHHGCTLREDFDIDERVGREFPGGLRGQGARNRKREKDERFVHRLEFYRQVGEVAIGA
jgi:hypothetical protein